MTNPGWSTKLTTGRRKASHTSTKRASLSDASAGQPAGVVVGVRGEDAHGAPVEARQAREDRSPEAGAELEDRAGVEDELEHAAHAGGLAAPARGDGPQPPPAAPHLVASPGAPRPLPRAPRRAG